MRYSRLHVSSSPCNFATAAGGSYEIGLLTFLTRRRLSQVGVSIRQISVRSNNRHFNRENCKFEGGISYLCSTT